MSKSKKHKDKMHTNLDKKFHDILGEQTTFGNEKIERKNVAEADREYCQLFGANKNLSRVIPSLLDGLRPGKRRLFYSWWESQRKPTNTKPETLRKLSFTKVATIVSNAMGTYHPHGDSGLNGMIENSGQYWNNNVMEIIPRGNYGNQHGEGAAANRYIEASMSEYMIDCFFDSFDKYPLEMVPSYNGMSEEPTLLPAKYPHVLFNPQFSGIGFGLASNIPPFNVTEVLDATIALIKDSNSKVMIYPDIPSGCDIVDTGNFKDIMKTGEGKVVMRATVEINYEKNIIKVTSLPLDITSTGVTRKIVDLIKKGDLKTVIDIDDYTTEDVNLDIILHKDAKPDKVLKTLFKKDIGLETTRPVGIKVIDDYSVYSYGVVELLKEWIDYRIDMVRSMFLNDLQISLSKEHMNKILLSIFSKDNIDKTIDIAKNSKTRQDTIDRFMKTFKISSLQAATVADMKVYNFNKDSYKKYQEEEKRLKARIKELEEVLESDDNIKKYIIRELEEGKKKWGRPRKSKIIKASTTKVADTEHLVAISENGYIKKLPLKSGIILGTIGDSNSFTYSFKINNRDSLLIVDSTGNLIKLPISKIPCSTLDTGDIGYEIKRFCGIKGSVKTVMDITNDELHNSGQYYSLLIVTKKGIAKRTPLSEFEKIKDTMSCITLNENDEVASAIFVSNNSLSDVILNTNIGNGIRLKIHDIKMISRVSKGVKIVTLEKGEEIIDSSVISGNKKLLFYITSSGRAKVTLMKNFPTMNRKDKTLNLITLKGDERLLKITEVNKTDNLLVYRKKSEPVQISINDLEPVPRMSAGIKLIKTGRGDMVIGYKKL